MAKKDFDSPQENIDRKGSIPLEKLETREADCDETENKNYTEVKNAHAAGMGSIGRNDEKLKADDTSADKY